MPLSTDLHTDRVILAAVCAVTAAGLHWAAVVASADEVRPRAFRGNLVASAAGGLLASQLLELLPSVISPLLAVAVVAVVGHTLGPQALWWFGRGALGGVDRVAPWFKPPDLPPPPGEQPPKEKPPDA
ncbi:hypothetical protein DAETH_29070 [Deinococcus aetherius]|uniref:Uncharacterized protein n=1 Tax=Deinococcus aetherius TaxID=200252 RepID=A0ABM8AGL0_9DEIO|nr:hypothetical protein [Deinococcus aetherius]BDP42938.1 hypothetical protein DAETH_29070 [Deinococcus aetherius]